MKRRAFVQVAALAAAAGLHHSIEPIARAVAQGAEPMKLTLGTATPGGGFPVYGDAVIASSR